MLPALDIAAAFYGQHMPDGLPREQRNAIRDALAALIAAERRAAVEACANVAEGRGQFELAAALRNLPME
jgi:hypothetical protein